MRSFVPQYEMVAAKSLPDAFSRMAAGWKPFAGGTDLMVLFEAGRLPHKRFVSIWGLADLKGIEAAADSITLGALTTYTEVQRHPLVRDEFPLLARAASETGGIATQNRGTLGGNIVNASPAADTPPALLVYDAELELVSAARSRWIPYRTFHTGYRQTLLRDDELVARIRVPRREGWSQYYRKVGTRRAQAISKVCLAATIRREGSRITEARVALGSVAPTVVRCYETERRIERDPRDIAAARAALAREIAPIDDIRSTANYRLTVAANLLEDFLRAQS
ncbi:MAG TPA: xanthine dehydrogenase family protein subunit M [Bryobacteraceae bacterium]|nr:xanthine dehydrogenase family protein subunit M [Bryobacteraceae bacterium]